MPCHDQGEGFTNLNQGSALKEGYCWVEDKRSWEEGGGRRGEGGGSKISLNLTILQPTRGPGSASGARGLLGGGGAVPQPPGAPHRNASVHNRQLLLELRLHAEFRVLGSRV